MSQATSQNWLVGHLLAALKAGGAGLGARDRDQLGEVQAVLVDDGAGVVLHGDDLGAGLGEQFGRDRAHVAEALHRDARTAQIQAEAARRFAAGDEHAAAGGLDAARASRPGAAACR